jgi:hypothetical protein
LARTDGIAIACRTVKGWVVPIGLDFLSEDETEGFANGERQGASGADAFGDFAYHELAGIFEREQRGPR